jgi:hypothetical protein
MSLDSYKTAMSAPIKREPAPEVVYTDTSLLARFARLFDSWVAAVFGGRWL